MKRYWFKAKKYGLGWYPASLEGWFVLFSYIAYMTYRAVAVEAMFDTKTSFVFRYFFEFLLPTILLIIICYLTGEKLKWRWGKK